MCTEAGLVLSSAHCTVYCAAQHSMAMGLIKTFGCFTFLLFSCYMLLQAERMRRYLVGETSTLAEGAAEHSTISEAPSSQNEESDSFWINVGINFFLLISTFLCYDLVVANILVLSLTSDHFFRRAPLRILLCGMVGVLGAAAWYEAPTLIKQGLQMN